MAEQTVRVKGYRETMRALTKVEKETARAVRRELREVAQPVADTAKQKLSRYAGASLGTIGPKVTTKGVFVTQRKKKVTGLRPDFGVLQMTEALMPALDEHEDDIVHGLEDALDHLIDSAGF